MKIFFQLVNRPQFLFMVLSIKFQSFLFFPFFFKTFPPLSNLLDEDKKRKDKIFFFFLLNSCVRVCVSSVCEEID